MILLAATVSLAASPLNGLGTTPPMGYNSWYDWTCNMSEKQLMASVDAFVAKGFPALGYKYFNLDDCWASSRHPNGTLIADPKFFPSGTLKPLADYVHSKGMLFGTYTDRGPQTCAGRPAAQDHEAIDAQTYADWGVDYLKEDSCHATQDHEQAFAQYGKMRDGLNKTGRPIMFSLCGWNDWYSPVGSTLGNLWRIGPDDSNWPGVLTNIDINAALSANAGPSKGWNDPCLLLAADWQGKLRQTEQQTRAQFSMWAVMASPLLISANVLNMSAMTLATYTNKEVIAVSQDPLGEQGTRIVGGSLHGGGGGGNVPAHVEACNAGAATAAEQWTLDSPDAGYVKNNGTGQCINSDDCKADLIYFACVDKGKTCAKDFGNMKFSFDAKNHFVSSMNGQCAMLDGSGNLVLTSDDTKCAEFDHDAASKRITTKTSAGTACLTTASKATGAANVWMRKLSTGAVAMVFINAGSGVTDIVCDATCLSAAGFSATDKLSIRDVWAHATSTASAAQPLIAKQVGASGGVEMFVLARVQPRQTKF